MKEGWEIVNIGSICNIITGKLDANASSESGVYPFFTCSRESLKIDNYAYDCECVLIAGNGDLNVKYYKGKFNAYQRTYIVTLKNDIKDISVKYIFKFFEKYVEKLRQLSIGGVIKYIKLGDLTNAKIPVPPLSEQEKIVAELDCLSGIIEKKKQQLKELDSLAQSIFYEMFGDPVENEKGWEVKKLGELGNSELGKMLDSKKNQGDLYPYLCSLNVKWNDIDYSQIKEMRIKKDELDRYRVKKGDLLICEGGDTGRCAIWKSNKEIYYQNALHRVRLNEGLMLPIFCLFVFKIYKENGEIDKYSTGQTIKHLVKKTLLIIPIPTPPLSLQQQFANKIELIEKQKELIKQSIKETETLFDSRMDYYFNS